MLYMVTFTINIPQMLAYIYIYIPYMDLWETSSLKSSKSIAIFRIQSTVRPSSSCRLRSTRWCFSSSSQAPRSPLPAARWSAVSPRSSRQLGSSRSEAKRRDLGPESKGPRWGRSTKKGDLLSRNMGFT